MKIRTTLTLGASANKIHLIKAFRIVLGLGLKEAKDFVEHNLCKRVTDHERLEGYSLRVRTGDTFTIILSPESFCRYALNNMADLYLQNCEIVKSDAFTIDTSHL